MAAYNVDTVFSVRVTPMRNILIFFSLIIRSIFSHIGDISQIFPIFQTLPPMVLSQYLSALTTVFYKTQEMVFLVVKFLQVCFDHRLVPLAYMSLSTNCQGLLYIGIINRIELVSSSTRVTSAKFQKALGGTQRHRDP